MRCRLFSKWRRNAGQSTVELALMLPVLTALVLGTFDVSRALRAKNMLIHLSREGANQAMNGPRDSATYQAIMTSLAATTPLKMEQDGMMYVTEIKVAGGVRTVTQTAWNKNPNGPCSQIDRNNPAGAAGTIPVPENGSVCIFEVVYNYDSLLLPSYAPQLQSTTVF